MKNINKYILEKLKIDKDIDINTDDMEEFIESFKGNCFNGDTKKLIINLLIKCTIELEHYTYEDDHWCYIVEDDIYGSSNGYRGKDYSYSSNEDNEHLKIGDKTKYGGKVIFIVKKGDEVPKKYLGYEYKY